MQNLFTRLKAFVMPEQPKRVYQPQPTTMVQQTDPKTGMTSARFQRPTPKPRERF